VQKTYGPGQLAPGSAISGYLGVASQVLVFNASEGVCSPGGNGQVEITWQ
jgi:hypothetical protein